MRKPSRQGLLIHSHTLSRRAVIAGLPLLVAGCSGSGRFGSSTMQDGGFTVPEINLANVDPSLLRQEVAWRGNERPGSIVVVVPERRLYLVQGNGRRPRRSAEFPWQRGDRAQRAMASLDTYCAHDRSDAAL